MRVFIVPYRDRNGHQAFFRNYLPHVCQEPYRILFIHQRDDRPFNRGAMKNIGFLVVKELYPDTYKTMTLVFNDVDIMPSVPGMFHYDTVPGVIRHNYGYTSCLSACFAVKGGDFERTNGFPNIWAWGLEDFLLQERALSKGLKIDRSRFRFVGDKEVLQFFDGSTRDLSGLDVAATRVRHASDGLDRLTFSYELEGDFVQVDSFRCMYQPDANFVRMPIDEINARPSNPFNLNRVTRTLGARY